MNKPINDGGPAFPQQAFINTNGQVVTADDYFPDASGMSLRDWFAGQASEEDIEYHMKNGKAAIKGTDEDDGYGPDYTYPTRESARYAYADAMLAARQVKEDAP
jgi:hypothetical protein